jgi:hypothetical protein
MKIRFFIILFAFTVLSPLQLVYAPPSVNPDWQSYPYCPGGCSNEYLKTEWAKYYDIKDSKWMEGKKQEMFAAIENGSIDEWLDEPTMAHSNVRTYYFYQGEVPNFEGKLVEQVFLERDLRDLENSLKQNQIPLGNGFSMNLTVFAVFLGGGIVGIVFAIRKKRR